MNDVIKSYVYCFVTIFLFSTLEFVSKLLPVNISPVLITGYRFFIGGIFLYIIRIISSKKEEKSLSVKDYLNVFLCGVLNVCISMWFLQLSVFYGKASIAAILISVNPLFVMILASFILKEKIKKTQVIGIIMGFAGIVLILGTEKGIFDSGSNLMLGIIFGLLSSITFALYTVLSKKYIEKTGNLRFNSFSFIWASIIMFLIAFIKNDGIQLNYTVKEWSIIFYLGIFVSGLAYFLFFQGLKHIPAATGSSFFLLKPVMASVMAFFIIGEVLNIYQISGIILVIFSLIFETLYEKIKKTSL